MTQHQETSFSRTWWGSQWLQALARVIRGERLSRGRAYARLGQVRELTVQLGLILAQVKGTRPQPYQVRIEIDTLTDKQWADVMRALGNRASYAAELLNGVMPQQVQEAFDAAGAPLYPTSSHALHAHCSCADPVRPCKHVAAACYIFAEELDKDPFLLFTLRGWTREQVLAALRIVRAEQLRSDSATRADDRSVGEDRQPLTSSPADFWRIGNQASEVSISIRAPEIETELLKILGDPEFAQDESISTDLQQVYHEVSRRALQIAYAASIPDAGLDEPETD